MSSLYDPLPVVSTIDSRLNLSQEAYASVQHVAQNLNYRVTTLSSYPTGTGGNSLNVVIPIDSYQTLVSRVFFLRTNKRYTFTGTDQGSPLVVPGSGFDAIRWFPFQSCCTNTSVQLGNQSFSQETRQLLPFISRLIDCCALNKYYNQLDFYQEYNDSVSNGDSVNPLASVGSNIWGSSRGGIRYSIVSSSNTQVIIDVDSVEPIVCQPFLFPHLGLKSKAFTNLQQVSLNFQYVDLSNSWSHSSAGNTLTSVTCVLQSAPQVYSLFLQQNILVQGIPESLSYSFYDMQPFANTQVFLASGGSATMTSDVVNLDTIPSYIAVYVQQRTVDKTFLSSDTFARINSANFTNGLKTGILAEASMHDLWMTSVKNGVNLNWAQWDRWTGSVLLVAPEDLGLNMNLSEGAMTNTNLQVTVNVTNIGSGTKTYELVLVPVFESLLQSTGQGQFVSSRSYLTQRDVVNAEDGGELMPPDMEGSGLFSGFKRLARRAGKWLWKHKKVILPAIAKLAFGTGRAKTKRGGVIKGGKLYTGRGMEEEEDEGDYEGSGNVEELELKKNIKDYVKRRG